MAANGYDDDQTRSFTALSAGTRISHYTIVSKIGAGGMGEVYLAEDTELHRKVALKFLPMHLCQDDDCRKRFKREAQAAAKLDHPNIVAIHEVDEFQGRPFYSMQIVEGRSLKEVIAGKDLPIDRIVDICIQLCAGLQAAHDKGIIHRDVKPSNILLDSHGRVRIVDFGLAAIGGSEHLTKTGLALGTIGYMSPEQVHGREVDHRSDLFSMGIVMYELISKQNPFRRDNDAATLKALVDDRPQPLARYNRAVAEVEEVVVGRLLEKNPSHRYQSATEVLTSLERLRAERPSSSPKECSEPSIAVLPFANLSGDPEQEYFCDGMAEEIINTLANTEGLRVVARTSCFAFKDKNEDIRNIGQQLNVDHILEGSIRKAGNRLRITGQLVKISDGFHLWSEKYDRDLEDIFDIQDEIALAIATNLNTTLLGRKGSEPSRQQTADIDAYRLYLKARWLFDQRTDHSIRESIDCYTRAITEDPNFARAYTGLAFSYCELPQFSAFPQEDALNEARQAAEKALELDGTLAEAHTALGVILAEFDWNWTKAEQEYLTALTLNSSSAETRFWYALLLLYQARVDEAVAQMKQAQELDPLSLAINKYLGLVYLCAGNHEASEKTLKSLMEIAPKMTYPRAILGLQYLDKEMFAEALALLQEEEDIAEEVPSMITAWKAVALVGVERPAEVKGLLEDLMEGYERNRASPYALATVHCALEDINNCFRWLTRAVDERDYWLRYLKVDPTMRRSHKDPRFEEILASIGLV